MRKISKEFLAIDTTHLRNNAHIRFMGQVNMFLQQEAGLQAKCDEYVAYFQAKLQQEDDNYKISQKSLLTDEIAAADRKRDEIYLSFKKIVDGMLTAPMPAVAAAAKVVNQLLIDYRIDVQMHMEEEAGALEQVLSELEGRLAPEVQTMGLGFYVEGLRAAEEEFNTAMTGRLAERRDKVAGAMRISRLECDEAYRLLCKTVEAYAWIEGDEVVGLFVDNVNALIRDYLRNILGETPTSNPQPGDEEGTTPAENDTPDTPENDTPDTPPAGGEEGGNGNEGGNENENEGGTTPPPPAGNDDDEIIG